MISFCSKPYQWFLLIALASSLSFSAFAGEGPTRKHIQATQHAIHQLNEQLFMIEPVGVPQRYSSGNTAVLVGDDGVLIVDTQYQPMYESLVKSIRSLSEKPVRFAINTHGHPDHSQNNPEFFVDEQSTIIAHTNARKYLKSSHDVVFKGEPVHIPAQHPDGWPVITFDESVEVHMNNETVRAIYVGPAHSSADAVIHFVESNVFHMGDLIQFGMPYFDAAHLVGGGSAQGMADAYFQIGEMCDENTRIIPGHGQIMSCEEMLTYGGALKLVVDRVKKAISEGKTLDEIQAARLGDDYYPSLNKSPVDQIPPEMFIEAAYHGLKGQ